MARSDGTVRQPVRAGNPSRVDIDFLVRFREWPLFQYLCSFLELREVVSTVARVSRVWLLSLHGFPVRLDRELGAPLSLSRLRHFACRLQWTVVGLDVDCEGASLSDLAMVPGLGLGRLERLCVRNVGLGGALSGSTSGGLQVPVPAPLTPEMPALQARAVHELGDTCDLAEQFRRQRLGDRSGDGGSTCVARGSSSSAGSAAITGSAAVTGSAISGSGVVAGSSKSSLESCEESGRGGRSNSGPSLAGVGAFFDRCSSLQSVRLDFEPAALEALGSASCVALAQLLHERLTRFAVFESNLTALDGPHRSLVEHVWLCATWERRAECGVALNGLRTLFTVPRPLIEKQQAQQQDGSLAVGATLVNAALEVALAHSGGPHALEAQLLGLKAVARLAQTRLELHVQCPLGAFAVLDGSVREEEATDEGEGEGVAEVEAELENEAGPAASSVPGLAVRCRPRAPPRLVIPSSPSGDAVRAGHSASSCGSSLDPGLGPGLGLDSPGSLSSAASGSDGLFKTWGSSVSTRRSPGGGSEIYSPVRRSGLSYGGAELAAAGGGSSSRSSSGSCARSVSSLGSIRVRANALGMGVRARATESYSLPPRLSRGDLASELISRLCGSIARRLEVGGLQSVCDEIAAAADHLAEAGLCDAVAFFLREVLRAPLLLPRAAPVVCAAVVALAGERGASLASAGRRGRFLEALQRETIVQSMVSMLASPSPSSATWQQQQQQQQLALLPQELCERARVYLCDQQRRAEARAAEAALACARTPRPGAEHEVRRAQRLAAATAVAAAEARAAAASASLAAAADPREVPEPRRGLSLELAAAACDALAALRSDICKTLTLTPVLATLCLRVECALLDSAAQTAARPEDKYWLRLHAETTLRAAWRCVEGLLAPSHSVELVRRQACTAVLVLDTARRWLVPARAPENAGALWQREASRMCVCVLRLAECAPAEVTSRPELLGFVLGAAPHLGADVCVPALRLGAALASRKPEVEAALLELAVHLVVDYPQDWAAYEVVVEEVLATLPRLPVAAGPEHFAATLRCLLHILDDYYSHGSTRLVVGALDGLQAALERAAASAAVPPALCAEAHTRAARGAQHIMRKLESTGIDDIDLGVVAAAVDKISGAKASSVARHQPRQHQQQEQHERRSPAASRIRLSYASSAQAHAENRNALNRRQTESAHVVWEAVKRPEGAGPVERS
jgi:hypothetical protein